MADDIDYDELDQALRGAIRHEKQTKTSKNTSNKASTIKKALNKSREVSNSAVSVQKKTPSSRASSATNNTAAKSQQNVAVKRKASPRGHYMDMVGATTSVKRQRAATTATPRAQYVSTAPVRKSNPPRTTVQTSRKVTSIKPSATTVRPKRVAQQKPIVPVSYPESTIIPETQQPLPQNYIPTAAPQITKPTPTPTVSSPVNTPAPQSIPQAPTVQQNTNPVPINSEAPLGARSPYMINNATVSKRPLSNDVKEGLSEVYDSNNKVQPEALPPELQSRNNKKTSIKKTQEKKKKENEESSHDWKWTLTMLIVIIAGAVAGYLFYILFADKLPF